MDILLPVLIFLLLASLSANTFFFFKLKKPAPVPTYDARELLNDLTRGSAIVRVTRIDPENLMLRSPRGIS